MCANFGLRSSACDSEAYKQPVVYNWQNNPLTHFWHSHSSGLSAERTDKLLSKVQSLIFKTMPHNVFFLVFVDEKSAIL